MSRPRFVDQLVLAFMLALASLVFALTALGEPREPVYHESGLIITHLRLGEGTAPGPASRVTVHYTGRFLSGEVFDSSVERGQPATFPLDGVIACWTEALQLMKVGGRAALFCPHQIAYGAPGAPPVIPPNTPLQFEVELLAVE